MLIYGNRLSPSATCVRTSFLRENNLYFNDSDNYVIIEDYDLWLRLAKHNAVFSFIACPLGEYAVQEKSISLNTKKARHNLEIMLRNHVYHVQTFSNRKDLLWSIVSFRLLVSDMGNKYKDKPPLLRILSYFSIIIKYPVGAVYYIRSLITRKLRSYFLDFKFRNI